METDTVIADTPEPQAGMAGDITTSLDFQDLMLQVSRLQLQMVEFKRIYFIGLPEAIEISDDHLFPCVPMGKGNVAKGLAELAYKVRLSAVALQDFLPHLEFYFGN